MSEEPNWSEFAPDIDAPGGSLSGGIDLLRQVGIVQLYTKWIGKSTPSQSQRTESIMVSCPQPHHPDKNPSAWLNSEKDVWYCAACGVGGDVMDLASIRFGINYRTSGDPKDFAELLERALIDVGVDVEALKAKNADDAIPKIDPASIQPAEPEEEGVVLADDEEPVSQLLEDAIDLALLGALDWKEICSHYPDTFLDKWMQAVSISDVPDEFLLWLGAQTVGLAAGRDCWLNGQRPVYPCLQIAMIGRTGSGKTRSVEFATEVLAQALPFDSRDASCRGVQQMGRPASGEALYEMFSWYPEGETEPQPVRGLLDIDELSELMSAAKRKGSTLREAVIALSDGKELIQHRARSTGSINVRQPFMSMVVGGQPDSLSNILSGNDASSGFANRFIFVSGTKKPRQGWLNTPKVDLGGLAEKLESVHVWSRVHSNGPEKGSIDFEDDAALVFDELVQMLDGLRELPQGDIFARLELQAMKLIVILCVNAKTDLATVQMVQDVRHMIESILPVTSGVAESITEDEDLWYRNRIVNCIERATKDGLVPPSRNQIEHHFHSSKRKKVAIASAIAYLERIGLIKKVRLEGATGKKQVDRWMLS